MNQRLNRVDQLLKEEISKIIQQGLDDPAIGFITVTRVKTCSDLRLAKVYITVIGDEKKDTALKAVNKASKYIKRRLSEKITLRYLPDLKFYEDESINEGMRIEKLFRQIEEKKKEKDKNEL
ncbi:MAG: 30S ribosome-binding factor RbfA [Candidatus Omnitrophica bacterium]|nr:30S ribosome-binding factor RbfA [Candidatus Omnitrophota bacterium]